LLDYFVATLAFAKDGPVFGNGLIYLSVSKNAGGAGAQQAVKACQKRFFEKFYWIDQMRKITKLTRAKHDLGRCADGAFSSTFRDSQEAGRPQAMLVLIQQRKRRDPRGL